MSEKIDALLKQNLGSAGIFYLIGFTILGFILLFGVIIVLRLAYHIERLSGKKAFVLPKSITVAVVPGIYVALDVLDVDVSNFKTIVVVAAVIIVAFIAVLNLKDFGVLGCLTMTFSQCLYGALIVLGVMSIGFMLVAGAAIAIATVFGGGTASSASPSRGVPSYLRDVNTNESFHTTKGVNGMPYVCRNGTDIPIRESSFAGRYIDDYGNEYV